MTSPHDFTLGQRVRCIVTDYEGILIARVEHLNGCIQYCVKAQVDPEKPRERPEGYYIDSEQLELVDEGILDSPAVNPLPTASVGGPESREGALPR